MVEVDGVENMQTVAGGGSLTLKLTGGEPDTFSFHKRCGGEGGGGLELAYITPILSHSAEIVLSHANRGMALSLSSNES